MWQNPQFHADLVTFTEIILNGKLHFLCSEWLWELKNIYFSVSIIHTISFNLFLRKLLILLWSSTFSAILETSAIPNYSQFFSYSKNISKHQKTNKQDFKGGWLNMTRPETKLEPTRSSQELLRNEQQKIHCRVKKIFF